MNQLLDLPHGNLAFEISYRQVIAFSSYEIFQHRAFFPLRNRTVFKKRKRVAVLVPSPVNCKLVDKAEPSLEEKDAACDVGNIAVFPHIQTLRNFPKKEMFRKVVMVRFDSVILSQEKKKGQSPPATALSTIKYLQRVGAKVIMVSSWSDNTDLKLPSGAYASTEWVADFLSSMLELKVVPVKFVRGNIHSDVEDSEKSDILLLENLFHFKGESANCSKFAKELASGVDIIVNDAFSQSHKVLASTVGVAGFCCAYIAGFYFEEGLYKLKNIVRTRERPYMAIIGGGNLADKSAALQNLASTCDGLLFVGSMAFQIMHALGVPVPEEFVELGALKAAVSIVESAKSRNIPLVFPKDVWCIKDHKPEQLEIFSVNRILKGWQPVDIGPSSLQEMIFSLSKCKRILWIGPLKFSSSRQDKVVWEVLKGRSLPGLMALDRAYPFHVDWTDIYSDPTRPLVVDIGSGNGFFLFGMARRRKDLNFLGLEINAKLVDRCLDNIHQYGIQNVHFFATNATSNFRSIVSSYPGELVLVSIQCPNPNFNRPEYRWRMLQRLLVEAVADILMLGGEVFLQSDIEAVAVRMKNEFLEYGKGKFALVNYAEDEVNDEGQWLKENPFGVPTDWEKHVLDRGDPMYRLLLSKVESRGSSK